MEFLMVVASAGQQAVSQAQPVFKTMIGGVGIASIQSGFSLVVIVVVLAFGITAIWSTARA